MNRTRPDICNHDELRNLRMNALVCLLTISFVYPVRNVGAQPIMRCFNEPRSVKTAVRRSTAVFSGEVLEIKSGGNFLVVRFRVERFWKGVTSEEVSVSSDSTVESPHYRVGEKYLVFAGLHEGKLFTGSCSRTRKLEYAQRDLDQLGEGRSPSAKSNGSGRTHY
jgi:hypothetical protein